MCYDTSRQSRRYLRKHNLSVVLSKIGRKEKLKIFLKPIDILYNIVYNISTKKREDNKNETIKKSITERG